MSEPLTLSEHTGSLAGEREFSIVADYDSETGAEQVVRVHPWDRYARTPHHDRSVFISVGWFSEAGEECDDLENPVWNAIVDRDDFVEGIIHAFPELQRKSS